MPIPRPLLTLILGLLALPAEAGLKAFYTFEGNGNDLSGQGLAATAGTPSSTPVLVTGYQGQAMGFDGIDDYLTVGLDVNPSVMPAMTWGAWVNAADNSGIRQVLSHDNGGYDRSLGIDQRAAGSYAAFTGSWVLGNGGVAALSQWVFLAAVYDQASTTLSLWVNGDKVSTTASLGPGHDTFRIGSNPGFGEYFSGAIDNVFVFDQALTDTQINAIFTGGASAILAAPVPEPETYALMMAGLALLGARARRHK